MMRQINPLPNLEKLKAAFPAGKLVQKSEIKDFYTRQDGIITEQAFRRKLYGLEKQQVITPIGAGLYAFQDAALPSGGKKQFLPTISPTLTSLSRAMQETFPYLDCLIWETRLLHEWMIHQPAVNQVLIETEIDACESVFNYLKIYYPGKVFLEPDRVLMDRYVTYLPESILVIRLASQSPRIKVQGSQFPRLEKILVDIFADLDRFYSFQGDELVQIYQNVFHNYWINEKTLFRYAGRRKADMRLRAFIKQYIEIEATKEQERNK